MDDTLITCDCGAKLKLPEGASTRALRCPQCKQTLVLTAEATVLSATPLDAGQDAVCPICQTEIDASEPCVTCPGCDQTHHQECWSEVGGCGTYGCRQAPAIDKSDDSVQAPLSAWGDTKKCPACGEEIKAIALRCRYCGTDFDSVDPMSVRDLRKRVVAGEKTDKVKQSVIALFVVSLLGCPAPLIALIAPLYVLPRRAEIAKCGPLFVIMSWTSIALSLLYTLLIAAMWISEGL